MSAPSRLSKQQIQFELALMIQKWLEGTKYRDMPPAELIPDDVMLLARCLSTFVEECQERR